MIARVVINNGTIKDARLQRPSKIIPLDHTETSLKWGRKWSLVIDFCHITAESSRPARDSKINKVIYRVKHDGVAEARLLDESGSRIIKVDKVFTTPGDFNGILKLHYEENGHRWAEFISSEMIEFCKERSLDVVVRKIPSDLNLEIGGAFIDSYTEKVGNVSVYRTDHRSIETDGQLLICSTSEHTFIRVVQANWLVLEKIHVDSGKVERILFTRRSLFDLGIIPMVKRTSFEDRHIDHSLSQMASCALA